MLGPCCSVAGVRARAAMAERWAAAFVGSRAIRFATSRAWLIVPVATVRLRAWAAYLKKVGMVNGLPRGGRLLARWSRVCRVARRLGPRVPLVVIASGMKVKRARLQRFMNFPHLAVSALFRHGPGPFMAVEVARLLFGEHAFTRVMSARVARCPGPSRSRRISGPPWLISPGRLALGRRPRGSKGDTGTPACFAISLKMRTAWSWTPMGPFRRPTLHVTACCESAILLHGTQKVFAGTFAKLMSRRLRRTIALKTGLGIFCRSSEVCGRASLNAAPEGPMLSLSVAVCTGFAR